MKNEIPEAGAATKTQLDLSAIWKYLVLKTATSILDCFVNLRPSSFQSQSVFLVLENRKL